MAPTEARWFGSRAELSDFKVNPLEVGNQEKTRAEVVDPFNLASTDKIPKRTLNIKSNLI